MSYRYRSGVLAGGIVLALIVLFVRPIQSLLDAANDVQHASGLAIVPAMAILLATLVFERYSRRVDARAAARVEADVAREAHARAAELDKLVEFSQALGRSLDLEAIREVVRQQLPGLAGTGHSWVMLRADGHWQMLAGAADRSQRDMAEGCERMLGGPSEPTEAPDAMSLDGELLVPITAGGQHVGVLGLREDRPIDESRRQLLAAAATLLGITLRHAQLFRDIREHSVRDGLTGCFNRTHAMEVIDTELRRARRSLSPLSLIMFDLDRFKEVNDRYGHLCGDAVLAAVGARMRDVLRGSDLKCRYGGEEFLVLLPDTPLEGAKRVADSLRKELAALPILWKNDTLNVTASFGVSTALPAEMDPQGFIGRADSALYRAKHEGRNCVRVGLPSNAA